MFGATQPQIIPNIDDLKKAHSPEPRRACSWCCGWGVGPSWRRNTRWRTAGLHSRPGTGRRPLCPGRRGPSALGRGSTPRTASRCPPGTAGRKSWWQRARRTRPLDTIWSRPRWRWTWWPGGRPRTRATCASGPQWRRTGRRSGRSMWTRSRRSICL